MTPNALACPRCKTANPPHAKFCLECAAPLAARCASCGTQLPPSAKFCLECAHPVGAAAAAAPRLGAPDAYTPKHLADRILTSRNSLEGERKQVTVLFADLKGSMELLAERDPEDALAHEDHAVRACYAALRMQEALRRYTEELRRTQGIEVQIRVGVNSGEVVVRSRLSVAPVS